MLGSENTVVRSIAWMELFPWLRLIRLFRIALQLRLMLFAAIGLIAMNVGWIVIGETIEVFSVQEFDNTSEASLFDEDFDKDANKEKIEASENEFAPPPENGLQSFFASSSDVFPYPETVRRIMRPGEILLRHEPLRDLNLSEWIYLIACLLWTTFVWAVFGGAISRAVALQLTIDHPFSVTSMFRYGWKRCPSYLNAIFIPFGILLIIMLGIGLSASVLDLLHASILIRAAWPIFYLLGLCMIILSVGLYLGWPLMIASIATDDNDGFDAISRAYSYIYQRPLNTAFYTFIAALLGFAGLWIVELIVFGAVQMADRAIVWGAGPDLFKELTLFHEWVAWIPVTYVVTYFWAAAVGIYILLRKDIDQAELNHIGGAEEGVFEELPGVPPIGKDERGAPVLIRDQEATDIEAEPSDSSENNGIGPADSTEATPGTDSADTTNPADMTVSNEDEINTEPEGDSV